MQKIKRVEATQEGPGLKDVMKAAGAALRLDFRRAQRHLRGDLTVTALDSSGNPVFGMSGGSTISLVVHNDREAPPPPEGPTQAEIEAEMNAIASDATVLQGKVTVSGPLKIRKPLVP